MSVVHRMPCSFFISNRMHYQDKERRHSRERRIKEKQDLEQELSALKDEIRFLRRSKRELVKLFCSGKMIPIQMTSEHEKCGLSSLLSMSCRGRAEAFARSLHSKLRSLGSHDDNGAADESSWLGAHENPIALSQPRHSSDNDVYLDFGLLESPGSPDEELHETELHRLLNNDRLRHSHNEECHCPKQKEKKEKSLANFRSPSNDSDSDGSFYDTTENESDHPRVNGVNGDTNSETSKSQDSETGICISSPDVSNQEESFASTSDCTPQPCASLSEDLSTLSLKDSDCPSLEEIEPTADLPKSDSETDIDYVKCNGDVGEDKSSLTDSVKETETYVSSLSVDKDLTVECPGTVETASQTQSFEIQGDKNDDDSEEEERIPRVRRCSSLKTGKTPPGTPGRKKIVRFADALGLDLADVRTFLDEIPKVPNSAYEDLIDVDLNESSSMNVVNLTHGVKAEKILMPLFQQPASLPNFLDLVRDNQVCLENAFVEDPLMLSIKGTVRVRNLDFHKSVYIRYSLDSWKSFADVQATYVENSCDGFSDKFSFLIYAHILSVGQQIQFACRFQCKGCQYWDNNGGANYCFQCLPASHNSPAPPIGGIDDWGASFYYQEDAGPVEKIHPVELELDLTTTAVQDFILHTLATKERAPHKKKFDVLTVFVILVFSILFMYLQKAIYFTK